MADTPTPRLSAGLVMLMATATGVAVASNYYAQPLLPTIAAQLGISNASAGSIVTAAQVGYALGLMLLVPLADLFERRKLIVSMTLLSAAGLLLTALASGITQVLIGTVLTGLFSVVAQILLPFAATLAAPDQRGRVVGNVMSGLLLGILLARTIAGYFSSLGGWQTVYWFGAGMMVVTALALGRALPHHPQSPGLGYPRLLVSTLTLFVEEPVLRVRALLGAVVFCVFSMLWTSLSFLLAAAPYHYSDRSIGLFGLVGAAGALAAAPVGRWADRGKAGHVTSMGLGLLLLSWLPLAAAQTSVVALLVGVLVLDLTAQAIHVMNLSVINQLRPDASNRLTACYMSCYFIGGASGSVLSTFVYARAGWTGVSLAGALLSAIAMLAWRAGNTIQLARNGIVERN